MSTRHPETRWVADSLSTTEQNGHDQRMRETDLDAVDEAIPSTLQDSEVVVVSWVGDYVLYAGHRRVQQRMVVAAVRPSTIVMIITCNKQQAGSELDQVMCRMGSV